LYVLLKAFPFTTLHSFSPDGFIVLIQITRQNYKRKDVQSMRFLKIRNLLLMLTILNTIALSIIISNRHFIKVWGENNTEFELLFRLRQLEPEIPHDVASTHLHEIPLPTPVYSIQEVFDHGKSIDYKLAYNAADWVKPAYKTYWHSTTSDGRWSYVPRRINYAMHDIFTTYATASIYYDFIHDLGINDESRYFQYDPSKPLETIMVVTMKSKIQEIITHGNQVVVVVEPSRTGLQVFPISHEALKQTDKNSSLLFQLVTPDGYEIDHSLIYRSDRYKDEISE
jgi:hypothetical protein